MIAKEKAKELVDKYSCYVCGDAASKKCAIICVDERINAYSCPPVGAMEWAEKNEQFWQEVKQAINEL